MIGDLGDFLAKYSVIVYTGKNSRSVGYLGKLCPPAFD